MKQQKIKKILSEKLDELSGLCKKISPDFDKESIHNFRVAVKTFRSFLRLLRMNGNNDKHLILSKKIKRLYHIAGAIRDAQNELEKLTVKQLALPVYLYNLHQIINRQQNEWRKNYTKKLFHKFKSKVTGLVYQPLPKEALINFINMKMTAIHTLSYIMSPTDNQVHGIRKLVKDILYVSKLTEKNQKQACIRLIDTPIEKLEQIADAIGEYNDDRIMLDHISTFDSKTMTSNEKNMIKIFCDKQTIDLKKAKKKVLTMVKSMWLNK
jgi:CHAD domain-containing protein